MVKVERKTKDIDDKLRVLLPRLTLKKECSSLDHKIRAESLEEMGKTFDLALLPEQTKPTIANNPKRVTG